MSISTASELVVSSFIDTVWWKFQHSCAKSSNGCEQNHENNYFLINVACRSEANMIKWTRAAIFPQFRFVEDDLKLFCDIFH